MEKTEFDPLKQLRIIALANELFGGDRNSPNGNALVSFPKDTEKGKKKRFKKSRFDWMP